jgi:hypothetical protein
MGTAATHPRASREQVLAAVSALEGTGPVTIGQIAVHVAGVLGIDMSTVESAYALRQVISWQGLQTEVKHLVGTCNLVRRTEEDWHRVSRGLLFGPRPSQTTWAYCTPAGAQAVRELTLGGETMRRQLAEQAALRTLAARHVGEYRELVEEWLAAHPVPLVGRVGNVR